MATPIDFPNTPTVGQVFTTTDRSWVWTGTRWDAYGQGTSVFSPSPTPPLNPDPGDIWFDVTTGRSYIWYDGYWIEMTGAPASMDAALLTGTTLAANVVHASLDRGYRNRVVNGAFKVNQRGTAGVTSGYFSDRWFGYNSGAVSPIFQVGLINGSALLPPLEELTNYIHIGGTLTDPAGSGYIFASTGIEDVRTFAGRRSTLSFWAKATSGVGQMGVRIEQLFDNGVVGNTQLNQSVAVDDVWRRYSVAVNLPSIGSKVIGANSSVAIKLDKNLGTALNLTTANITGALQIAGVQWEAGPVATPFEAKPYSEVLRDCQWFFERIRGDNGAHVANGLSYSATSGRVILPCAPKRIGPQLSTVSGVWNVMNASGTGIALATLTAWTSHPTGIALVWTTGVSIVNVSAPVMLYGNNGSFIDLSADL